MAAVFQLRWWPSLWWQLEELFCIRYKMNW
uniref:Uncharacterized protein n=1 Tax=Anguilla anguilla TaxID=7936 RepID=A0A0E9TVG8_ANGAN